MSNFENLEVWKLSVDFCARFFEDIDKNRIFKQHFGLKDQMERAALSIPSNIAEGSGRKTKKDFLHFLYISRGSISELKTQLVIASKAGYINEKEIYLYKNELDIIHMKLQGLIRYIGESQENRP